MFKYNVSYIASICVCVTFALATYVVTPVNKEVGMGKEAIISCVVSGLTVELDNVKWTKSDNSAVPKNEPDNYVIDDGELDGNTQTTTLTVKGAANQAGDSTYNCLITSDEHGKTEDSTTVILDTFWISINDREGPISVAQTITCKIRDLSAAASVTWIGPDSKDISDSDTDNYVVEQGIYDDGSQTTTLTIKPAKLKTMSGAQAHAFKCSVTSGKYPDSPALQRELQLELLNYLVVPTNKEVEVGKDATIACHVSGITKKVNVKWTNSDSTDVATLGENYVVNEGKLDNELQITTLTVKGATNTDTGSSTYYCLLSSEEYQLIDYSTAVTLTVLKENKGSNVGGIVGGVVSAVVAVALVVSISFYITTRKKCKTPCGTTEGA